MAIGEVENDAEEGGVEVSCTICLEAVVIGGDRSTTWLQCGHRFHLDCIGSAFNIAGDMECPNCQSVESGTWLYANGSQSHPSISADERMHDENYNHLDDVEMPDQHRRCPFCIFPITASSFEPGSSSSFVNSSILPYYTAWGRIHQYNQYLQSAQGSLMTGVPQIRDLRSFNRTPNYLHYQAPIFLFPPAYSLGQNTLLGQNSARHHICTRECGRFVLYPSMLPLHVESSSWRYFLHRDRALS